MEGRDVTARKKGNKYKIINTDVEGYDRLIVAILRQAEADYKELRDGTFDKKESHRGKVTLTEVEDFFESEWCDRLCLGHGARYREKVLKGVTA